MANLATQAKSGRKTVGPLRYEHSFVVKALAVTAWHRKTVAVQRRNPNYELSAIRRLKLLRSEDTLVSETPTSTRQAELKERVQALRLPTPAKGATTSRLPWAICVLVSGLLAWQVYLSKVRVVPETEAAATSPSTDSKAKVAASQAPSSPANRDPDVVLEDKGHVIPAHQILVSPKVSGMIVELFIAEGRRISKGEVLAELEKVDYAADRDRALAILKRAQATQERALARQSESLNGSRNLEKEQAEAELAEAKTELTRVTAEHDRNVELKRKGALTDKDFDQSEASYRAAQQRTRRLEAALALMKEGERQERKDMARLEVTQAEADVLQAQADLVKAQWRLDNCTIRAPISGTILKKNAEEGNIVNPIAFNGSFSLCDMADLSDLEIDLSVGERDISKVFVGQRCEVRADAYKDRVYQGRVDRLMPIADRAKASVPVRVKVSVPTDEEGVYLKPEMGATVTFFKRDSATPVTDAEVPATDAEAKAPRLPSK